MKIQTVCVIGGGLMGRQIALNTAIYPYQVRVTDNNPQVTEAVRRWADEYLAGRIAKGRMTQEQVDGIRSRFTVTDSMDAALDGADLVIEAVVEREDVKRELLRAVSARVRPDTIIATNSSRMASSLFKDAVSNPSRLANLHYFNPALVMKLTEVVQGEHCSDETAQALCDFSRDTGKKPVWLHREIEGFVVNRILTAINNEARWLVQEGYCTFEDVDVACENGLGHPMGPFRLNDLTGLDLTLDIMNRAYEKTGVKPNGYDMIRERVEQGFLGKKSGRGFYEYK